MGIIKVYLTNIYCLELPLNTSAEVIKKSDYKRIVKKTEKKYKTPSYKIFCDKPVKILISEEDMDIWRDNYKNYVRSSFVYKFWIFIYKFCRAPEM